MDFSSTVILICSKTHDKRCVVMILTLSCSPLAGWWCTKAGIFSRTRGRCTTTPWLEAGWGCLSSLRSTSSSQTSVMSAGVRNPVRKTSVPTADERQRKYFFYFNVWRWTSSLSLWSKTSITQSDGCRIMKPSAFTFRARGHPRKGGLTGRSISIMDLMIE